MDAILRAVGTIAGLLEVVGLVLASKILMGLARLVALLRLPNAVGRLLLRAFWALSDQAGQAVARRDAAKGQMLIDATRLARGMFK